MSKAELSWTIRERALLGRFLRYSATVYGTKAAVDRGWAGRSSGTGLASARTARVLPTHGPYAPTEGDGRPTVHPGLGRGGQPASGMAW